MSHYSIYFSIIIPHKNIPALLQRCIDSIPKREDVQIIVIDDNSDPNIVDFSNFPGSNELNTEVYFTKESKGAGYARNVGLSKAKGRWLIFADADDFFNESFEKSMNNYKHSNSDMIVFKTNSVNSDTLEPVESRGQLYNKWINESINRNKVIEEVRYRISSVCSKFFSRGFVEKNEIRFDEVFTANDAMFSIRCGHLAHNITVDVYPLYCATVRNDSLTKTFDIDHFVPRFYVILNIYQFLSSVGKEKYRPNVWVLLAFFRKRDKAWINNYLKPAMKVMKIRHLITDFLKLINMRFFNGSY